MLFRSLDLRLGQRIGVSTFLETIPARNDSENLGAYISVIGINWQSFGTEVSFWF